MKKLFTFLLLTGLSGGLLGRLSADDFFRKLDGDLRETLASGRSVILEKRPDEGAETDSRFVTVGKLMTGSRETIWTVINDKENAAKFMTGVLESKVAEQSENVILVEQRTHVGGPKGSYRYRLRHTLTPMKEAHFVYVDGEIRDVTGAWWIFDGPAPNRFLVVYTLFIDPGGFAPRAVVKHGQKRSMPKALQSVEDEVLRREGQSIERTVSP